MKNLLTAEDQADSRIATMPEVIDPDAFDLVPADPEAATPLFPVHVVPTAAAAGASILNSDLATVEQVASINGLWALELRRGFYKAVVDGLGEKLFQVTGALQADGTPVPEVVNVG
jgi:hypothetical protein